MDIREALNEGKLVRDLAALLLNLLLCVLELFGGGTGLEGDLKGLADAVLQGSRMGTYVDGRHVEDMVRSVGWCGLYGAVEKESDQGVYIGRESTSGQTTPDLEPFGLGSLPSARHRHLYHAYPPPSPIAQPNHGPPLPPLPPPPPAHFARSAYR